MSKIKEEEKIKAKELFQGSDTLKLIKTCCPQDKLIQECIEEFIEMAYHEGGIDIIKSFKNK